MMKKKAQAWARSSPRTCAPRLGVAGTPRSWQVLAPAGNRWTKRWRCWPTIRTQAARRRRDAGGDDERARARARRAGQPGRIAELHGIREAPTAAFASAPSRAIAKRRRMRAAARRPPPWCGMPRRRSPMPPCATWERSAARSPSPIPGSTIRRRWSPPARRSRSPARAARRQVAAADFFVDWYTTALEPGEIVTAVLLPASAAPRAQPRTCKHARVAGDYATASAAVVLDARRTRCASPDRRLRPDSRCADDEADATCSARPQRRGRSARRRACWTACADPLDDVRGSADYRRLLIPAAAARGAVRRARARRTMDTACLSPWQVNGAAVAAEARAARHAAHRAARRAAPHRRQARLQPGRVRRLHRRDRRRADARLPVAGARLRRAADAHARRGWATTPRMQALQRAFATSGAFQCGFCTPGMLVAARALLAATRAPTSGDPQRASRATCAAAPAMRTIVAAVQAPRRRCAAEASRA